MQNNCGKPCCFLDTSASRRDCSRMKYVSGNQLIYNDKIQLYSRFIHDYEKYCKTKACSQLNCGSVNTKTGKVVEQLPYASSFEEVLQMRRAQNTYANPNYKNGIIQ